jgi:hypothetical protein
MWFGVGNETRTTEPQQSKCRGANRYVSPWVGFYWQDLASFKGSCHWTACLEMWQFFRGISLRLCINRVSWGASGRLRSDSTASTGSCPACGSFFIAPQRNHVTSRPPFGGVFRFAVGLPETCFPAPLRGARPDHASAPLGPRKIGITRIFASLYRSYSTGNDGPPDTTPHVDL